MSDFLWSVGMTNQDKNLATFTKAKVELLRKAHNDCVERGDETFVFEGKELLADYAKYLLEYLDGRM